jgi:hypothetical protein
VEVKMELRKNSCERPPNHPGELYLSFFLQNMCYDYTIKLIGFILLQKFCCGYKNESQIE